MNRFIAAMLGVLAVALVPQTHAAQTWTEGTHFKVVQPAQHTTVPAGKVEVMEVFSYGCVACNGFQPTIDILRRNLPPNAQMAYLPASFNASEDWPMFQRAYFTAQALGIADRTHQSIFDAVWKTGELAVVEPSTKRLRNPQPSLEDAAKCYARLTGVKPDVFLATAKSFSVDVKIRAADAQVRAMQVPGTPCIVVNGKYQVIMESLRSTDELIGVVKYLVARESTH
jgi:thiol:disulfide interchange protein DsbA